MDTLGCYTNYTAQELRELTGASLATARRWKRTNRAPIVVVRYLALLSLGAVSTAAAWAGWTVRRDGKLHSPEGAAFTPGEIRALPLRLQQISAMETERRLAREMRDQQAERDAAADHPKPVRARRQARRRRGDRLDDRIRHAVLLALSDAGVLPSSSPLSASPSFSAAGRSQTRPGRPDQKHTAHRPAPLHARAKTVEPATLTTSP